LESQSGTIKEKTPGNGGRPHPSQILGTSLGVGRWGWRWRDRDAKKEKDRPILPLPQASKLGGSSSQPTFLICQPTILNLVSALIQFVCWGFFLPSLPCLPSHV
ncbi:unnamed protein product, partial [Chrysoparadoxa australica]